MPTKLITYMLSTVLLFISLSCSANEPQHNETMKLTLTVEDASCIEAWLRARTENITLPKAAFLYRNDSLVQSFTLTTPDTIIADEGLEPCGEYSYKMLIEISDKLSMSAEVKSVRTMDTTSHEFTWEVFEFGEGIGKHSDFWDVFVIDENNIWAVGEIYTKDTYTYDSLGNFIQPYNSAFWNGSSWELKRILYLGGFAPITAIHAFSKNDIWFGMGYAIHYDGIMFREKEIPNWHIKINKIWGISSEDLYIVGSEGAIAHYDGKRWSRIESGTEVDILGITGDKEGRNIWMCGHDAGYFTTTFLRYSEGVSKVLFEGSPNELLEGEEVGRLKSVWTCSEYFTYGIESYYLFSQRTGSALKKRRLTEKFEFPSVGIKGKAHNEIYYCGYNGFVGYYNGKRHRKIKAASYDNGEVLTSVDSKGGIICAVGSRYIDIAQTKAVATIIKR